MNPGNSYYCADYQPGGGSLKHLRQRGQKNTINITPWMTYNCMLSYFIDCVSSVVCFQFPVCLYLRVTEVYLSEVKEEGLIDMKLNNNGQYQTLTPQNGE